MLGSCSHGANYSQSSKSCAATGQSYEYVDGAGNLVTLVDGVDGFTVSGPDIHSADVAHLHFFAKRKYGGVLVRNYGAINPDLLHDLQWTGEGLSCRATREQSGSSVEVVCINSFGEINGYSYDPGIGVRAFFAVNDDRRLEVTLKSPQGVFSNCGF